jgi:hypothetical protein
MRRREKFFIILGVIAVAFFIISSFMFEEREERIAALTSMILLIIALLISFAFYCERERRTTQMIEEIERKRKTERLSTQILEQEWRVRNTFNSECESIVELFDTDIDFYQIAKDTSTAEDFFNEIAKKLRTILEKTDLDEGDIEIRIYDDIDRSPLENLWYDLKRAIV